MAVTREDALRIGNRRSSWYVYRVVRKFVTVVLYRYCRVSVAGSVPTDGNTILAATHRSHLDSLLLSGVTPRRIRALGKDELFRIPGVGWMCAALGAVPVERGAADREAIKQSIELIDGGEPFLVFPEGSRQIGDDIREIFDGAAYLASKTNAAIVPVAIHGTDVVLPSGQRWPRRAEVTIVVGDALTVEPNDKGRVPRSEIRRVTEDLRLHLDKAMHEAAATPR